MFTVFLMTHHESYHCSGSSISLHLAQVFSCEYVKFLRIPFLQSTSGRLLLNTSKTEISLFRSKSKRDITKILELVASIFHKKQVKYLGLTINEHLDSDLYFSQFKKKLNCGIGLLGQIRYLTPKYLLKTFYFLLFNSNLIYGCHIWG